MVVCSPIIFINYLPFRFIDKKLSILRNKLFPALSYKNFANGVFTSSILSLLIFIKVFDDSLKNRKFIIKTKEIIVIINQFTYLIHRVYYLGILCQKLML